MNELLQKMECCICLSFLVDDGTGTQRTTQNEVAALQCGHLFHMPCVMQHLEHNATCPLCRLPATAAEHLVALDMESSAPLTPLNTLGECSPYQTSLRGKHKKTMSLGASEVKHEPKPPQPAASSEAHEKPRPPATARSTTYCALTNPRRALAILLRDTVNPAQAPESSQTDLSDGVTIVSHIKSRFRTRMILSEIFSVKDLGTLVRRESEFRDVVTGNELRQRNNIHTMKLDAIRRIDEQMLLIALEWRDRSQFLGDERRAFAASLAVDAVIVEEFTARAELCRAYPPAGLVRLWYGLQLRHIETFQEPYGRFDIISATEVHERHESFVRYQIDLDVTNTWRCATAEIRTAMVVDARTIAALRQQRMTVESQEILVRDELMSNLLHELYSLNFDALRALRCAPRVDVSGSELTARSTIADSEQQEFSSIVNFSLRHAQNRKHCADQSAMREHEALCRNALLTDEEQRWFKLLRQGLHEWHDAYVHDCAGLDDRRRFDAAEHRTRVDLTRAFLSESMEILSREEKQRVGILSREWQRTVLYERFIDGFLALQQQEFIHVKNITKAFQVAVRLTTLVPLTSILAKQEGCARCEIELFRDESLARMYKPWVAIRTTCEDEPRERSDIEAREAIAWLWVLDDLEAARFVDNLQRTIELESAYRFQVERDQASARRVIFISRYQWFCENRLARDNEQIAIFEEEEDARRVQIEDEEFLARVQMRNSGFVTFALADRCAITRRERDARALVNAAILFNVETLCRMGVRSDELAERVPLIQSSIHDIELVSRVFIQSREQAKFDAIMAAVNAPHPLIVAFEAAELRMRLSIMFDAEVSLNSGARNAKIRPRVDYRSDSLVQMFAQSVGATVDDYYMEMRQRLEHTSEAGKRLPIQLEEEHRFNTMSFVFNEAVQRVELQERETAYFSLFQRSRERIEANEIQYNDDVLMRAVDNVETDMRNVIDISSRVAILSLLSASDEHYAAQRKRLVQRIIEEQRVVIDKHLIGCLVVADEEAMERETTLQTVYNTIRARLAARPALRFAVSLHSIQLSLSQADQPKSLDEPFTAVITASGVTETAVMHITRDVAAGLTRVFVLAPVEDCAPPCFGFDTAVESVRVYVEVRRGERLMCHDSILVEGAALDGGVLSFVMASEHCNFAKVIFLANIQ
jgi:hypothetical protein